MRRQVLLVSLESILGTIWTLILVLKIGTLQAMLIRRLHTKKRCKNSEPYAEW